LVLTEPYNDINKRNLDFTALTDSAANQRMQLEAELQNQPSKPQQSSMIQRPDAAEKTI